MTEREKFYAQKTKYMSGHFFGPPGPGRHMSLLSEKPKETIKTLKKLFKYLKKYKLYFLLSFVCVLGNSILSLIAPYLVGKAIDTYIIPKRLTGFENFLFLIFLVYAFNSILVYIQSFTMANISQNVGYDLREDAFDCIHKLSLKTIDKRTTGDIMSRITNDIDMINMTLATSILQFFFWNYYAFWNMCDDDYFKPSFNII